MTTLAPSLDIGEVDLQGTGLSFFGHVEVFYFQVTLEWVPKEFVGVMTQDGFKYRGHWSEGDDFDKLCALFKADPRMPELTVECIKRRIHHD
jgi:hypothetical protein